MNQSGTASATRAAATNVGRGNIAPALMIRTLQGHVTMWSPAMEQRYGFTSDEALGKVAHELLRTIIWRPQHEIDAMLAERKSWSGGFIHRHSDGGLVMTAHHWHLHDAVDQGAQLVSELHSDISVRDEHRAAALADIIGGIGHGLSQPLTAVAIYIDGANWALQPAWPDKVGSSEALTAAAEQFSRIKEGMELFRELSRILRPSRGTTVATVTKEAEGALAVGRVEADDH